MSQSRERRVRAAGQWLAIMACIRWFSGSTSIVSEATPRDRAAATRARTRSEPTPRCWQASATTTPTSAVVAPVGLEWSGWSAAIACPTMTPSRTATIAWQVPVPPASSLITDGPGVVGAKNLR